jgi:hypothetical protein
MCAAASAVMARILAYVVTENNLVPTHVPG